MKELFVSLFNFNAVDCEILAAILYMYPQKKRSWFPLRLLFGIALMLACIPLLGFLQRLSIQSLAQENLSVHPLRAGYTVLLDIVLNIIPVILFIFWCCRLKLRMATYVGIFAFLTQDISYTAFCILCPDGAHRGRTNVDSRYFLIELLVMVLVFALFYWIFARKLVPTEEDNIYESSSVLFLLCILLVGQTISIFMKLYFIANDNGYVRYILIYDLLLALTILSMQVLIRREETLRAKLEMEEELHEIQRHNYESYRGSLDAINHLSHDLKYVVSSAAKHNQESDFFKKMEDTIAQYDTQVHTGNETLDTLFSDTALKCLDKKVQWTCMADGSAVDFFQETDLFIFAGNALSNALEAAEKVPDETNRQIAVNVWKKAGLSFFKVSNSFLEAPVMENGIPKTSKRNKEQHGYGTRSILELVEKYNGTVQFKVEEDRFVLNAAFPSCSE